LRRHIALRKQVNDLPDSLVGLVIGSFQLAFGAVIGIRSVVEATVGDWTAETLVEEQE
jgi:hypothetical protein